jgi:ATP-dependent helicase HrpB
LKTNLPIEALRDDLLHACGSHRRLIVRAPTGSGKSTQIPQMLLDGGQVPRGQVVVLQPRRLATRLLAARVARERGGTLGEEVGYQIRFEDVTSHHTRIKYVTEGILLRQWLRDPDLPEISAILFDEFHERHLYGDLTLARAIALQQQRRPDLLIGVMSATLDVAPLQTYLNPCATLQSEGRLFPVETTYLPRPLPPSGDGLYDAVVDTLEAQFRAGAEGDVLIFMPGAAEIRRTIRALEQSRLCSECLILPLHGELPPAEQDAAVATYDRRKIIVSTNVAETSLTIDGVRIVVDSGLARIPRFDPHRAINTLLIEKISRASADQRAGRAGRTAPGHCLRMWTETEHRGRALQERPEINRLDLSEALLNLFAAEISDLDAFPWFERPDDKALQRALTVLTDLGALHEPDADGRQTITPLGRQMAAFPVHPRYARMLITADRYGCVRQACLIAALTQGRPIMIRHTDKQTRTQQDDRLGESSPSDFFRLMRAWQFAHKNRYQLGTCKRLGIHAQAARQVQPVFDAFLRIAERQGLDVDRPAADDDAVCKAVLAGFADQVALRVDSGTLRCRLVHQRTGNLARDSIVDDAPLIVASQVDEIQRGKELDVLLTLATRIEEDWLAELFPEALHEITATFYDRGRKRVLAEHRRQYHDLVLEARPAEPDPDAAARILADEVEAGHCPLNKWDAAVDQWIQRVNNLAAWCPDLQLPHIGAAERRLVIEQLCLNAVSYKDVRDRPVWPAVKSLLSEAQQQVVQQQAPEKLEIGGRRPFRLAYRPDAPPHLAARIQELFGLRTLPAIACGTITPVLEILAPNQRPVQLTDNLERFWQEHYPRVRQELKRKYPKHAWPEDPTQPLPAKPPRRG